ncbi:MAG: DinB family protein [Bacteroidetes bacterium]|nr:DinB family protein [Bacteroidota bacterium]
MPTTIKQLLVEQYAACYNEESWFKPLKDVISDLSDEEFKWKESEEQHSIRQLVIHLLFYNEKYYMRFIGTPLPAVHIKSDNDPTFDDNDLSKEELLNKFYKVMDGLYEAMKNSPEEKFDERPFSDPDKTWLWWETLHNMNIHNAYHLGQMMLIKKQMRQKK